MSKLLSLSLIMRKKIAGIIVIIYLIALIIVYVQRYEMYVDDPFLNLINILLIDFKDGLLTFTELKISILYLALTSLAILHYQLILFLLFFFLLILIFSLVLEIYQDRKWVKTFWRYW